MSETKKANQEREPRFRYETDVTPETVARIQALADEYLTREDHAMINAAISEPEAKP